jgi:hypothetical protein
MNSTTHLTPEQSRELLDLCPELQRELRVGDWAEVKHVDIFGNHDSCIDLICCQDEYGNVYAGAPENGKWLAVTDCLLLPNETDLREALDRLMTDYVNSNWHERDRGLRASYTYRHLIPNPSGGRTQKHVINFPHHIESIDAEYVLGDTYLEALFNALCAVCKARTEGGAS